MANDGKVLSGLLEELNKYHVEFERDGDKAQRVSGELITLLYVQLKSVLMETDSIPDKIWNKITSRVLRMTMLQMMVDSGIALLTRDAARAILAQEMKSDKRRAVSMRAMRQDEFEQILGVLFDEIFGKEKSSGGKEEGEAPGTDQGESKTQEATAATTSPTGPSS